MTIALRWLAATKSGRSFYIYGPNRLHVAKALASAGEKMLNAREAGSWDSARTRDDAPTGLTRPTWDGTLIEDGRKSGIGT